MKIMPNTLQVVEKSQMSQFSLENRPLKKSVGKCLETRHFFCLKHCLTIFTLNLYMLGNFSCFVGVC